MIDVQLLTDMYYAAPELWYLLAGAVLALVTVIVWEAIKILRLRQKTIFSTETANVTQRRCMPRGTVILRLFIRTKKSTTREKAFWNIVRVDWRL